jgi:myo-inositol-1(or 4)-monophosphatase
MNAPNDTVLAVAVRAARRAAAVIGDASRDLKRLPTFSKERGEIVTGTEAEAMQAITATLQAAFPDHGILGDEGTGREGANADSPYRWIVDALDGTMNFVHGFPYYAV